MYHDFINYIRDLDPKFSQIDFTKDKENIKFLIKRELAYVIWGDKARFSVNILRDKQLNEAIKYFSKANDLLTMAGLLELSKRNN
jgi:hypothetical protein